MLWNISPFPTLIAKEVSFLRDRWSLRVKTCLDWFARILKLVWVVRRRLPGAVVPRVTWSFSGVDRYFLRRAVTSYRSWYRRRVAQVRLQYKEVSRLVSVSSREPCSVTRARASIFVINLSEREGKFIDFLCKWWKSIPET